MVICLQLSSLSVTRLPEADTDTEQRRRKSSRRKRNGGEEDDIVEGKTYVYV